MHEPKDEDGCCEGPSSGHDTVALCSYDTLFKVKPTRSVSLQWAALTELGGLQKNRGQSTGCTGSLAPDGFDDLGQMCEVELIRVCDHLLFKLVAPDSLGWFGLYSFNGFHEQFYN